MHLPPFPRLSDVERLRRLELPPGRLPVVLDTDTYNEIDDQFALAYALLSPDRIDLQAVHIAPFANERCADPAASLELSHAEAARVYAALDIPSEGKLFRGLGRYLGREARPEPTPASDDLIRRALAQPEDAPLVVVAIGAITNIANALLLEPRIVNHIVVLWLGGHALHWPDNAEFNFNQDVHSVQIVFDSGVPLMVVPCCGVASHLLISYPEIETHVEPCGKIGAFLADIYREAHPDRWGCTHTLWDTVTIAWLLNPDWVPHGLVNTPLVTDSATFSQDIRRPPMKYAYFVRRDEIIRDLLGKLHRHAGIQPA